MPSALEAIIGRFRPVQFVAECQEYRTFVQEVLAIPAHERRGDLERYYEFLEKMVDGIFDNYCDGTLSEAEKNAIFSLVMADWFDEAPGGLRASMLSLLGMLQPFPGIREWLLTVADRQVDAAYAAVLRDCAACPRTKPAV